MKVLMVIIEHNKAGTPIVIKWLSIQHSNTHSSINLIYAKIIIRYFYVHLLQFADNTHVRL